MDIWTTINLFANFRLRLHKVFELWGNFKRYLTGRRNNVLPCIGRAISKFHATHSSCHFQVITKIIHGMMGQLQFIECAVSQSHSAISLYQNPSDMISHLFIFIQFLQHFSTGQNVCQLTDVSCNFDDLFKSVFLTITLEQKKSMIYVKHFPFDCIHHSAI